MTQSDATEHMGKGIETAEGAPARHQIEDSWRVSVDERLQQGDETMQRLEEGLEANTRLTKQIAANTAGIVAFTSDLEAGAKLLCRVALGISWTLKTMRQNLSVLIVLLLAIAYFCNSERLFEICLKVLKAL
jgi:hypothetical protein